MQGSFAILAMFLSYLLSSSFSMRIWVLREIGQLSDILHFSLEMTNHPISFQRGAILPNLDPQNNFPISKCYLYIGFQYVKIETFPKCWRKLKKLTNVNQNTQQVYWREEISAFLHFWGVSFKTFSLFFKVLFFLKTKWMKNSNFYQFWAVIAEEWKKFNGCFFKLLSSLPSCYCCGRLNRPLNLTFEFRIKTRNIFKILPLFHHLWNYELLGLSFLI